MNYQLSRISAGYFHHHPNITTKAKLNLQIDEITKGCGILNGSKYRFWGDTYLSFVASGLYSVEKSSLSTKQSQKLMALMSRTVGGKMQKIPFRFSHHLHNFSEWSYCQKMANKKLHCPALKKKMP